MKGYKIWSSLYVFGNSKNYGDIWSAIEILKLGASKRPKNIFYCQKDKLKGA